MKMQYTLVPSLLAASIMVVTGNAYAQRPNGRSLQGASLSKLRQSSPSQKVVSKKQVSNEHKQHPVTLQTVLVTTGTRALNVTATTSLSPVSVLSTEELTATGAPDLTSALRVLLPSLNFAQPSGVDQASAIQPAQLRGLSPDDTLVLINGKRLHTSSVVLNELAGYMSGSTGTDLAAIPMNAIKRIEVLRDGAAAQYGSSAIAGVINIILKGGAKHGSASVTRGIYKEGDGQSWQGSADGGFALGENGWVHLSVNERFQKPTNRAGPNTSAAVPPSDPSFGKVAYHFGLPSTLTRQAAANMQYNVTPQAQLYFFGIFSKRLVGSGNFFRSLTSYVNVDPTAVSIYPQGFRPTEHSNLTDNTEVLGVRGVVAGWHYNLAADSGGNQYSFHTTNTINYDLGSKSPTRFWLGGSNNLQNVVTADFQKEFDVGWSQNPLSLAWGLEYRHQTYAIEPGEPAAYFEGGAQANSGFTPADAGRHSREDKAVYVDLQTDLTNAFSMEFAGRYEKYSDFGSTTPWKLAARYQFTNALAVRATASTGFRAPSLAQEFFSTTATQLDPEGVLVNTKFFPATNPAAEALGAKPLTAEQSHNYDLGVVYSPISGLNATLDMYQITIGNRIVQTENFGGPAVRSFLSRAGFPFVGQAAFFTNAVGTRTRGADLKAAYPFDFGDYGTLRLSVGGNWTHTTITSVKPNPPQLGLAGVTIPLVGARVRNVITAATPSTKFFVTADWKVGHWAFRSQLTRYGRWTYFNVFATVPQQESARYLLNIRATYAWKHWDFTLGADNVTNTYPERNVPANSVGDVMLYPLSSPFGFEGAHYYGRVAFNW